MTDAAILIHLSASYGAGLALEKEALLVKAFAEKITNAGLPVFLVGGNAELSQALKKSLQVTDLEPQISEIAAVRQILQDRKTAHVIVFTGIFPLYDEEITRHLFKIHTEYRADITYGENLPPERTDLGVALREVGFAFTTWDLTAADYRHAQLKQAVLAELEPAFTAEGTLFLYESRLGEARGVMAAVEAGAHARYLYRCW